MKYYIGKNTYVNKYLLRAYDQVPLLLFYQQSIGFVPARLTNRVKKGGKIDCAVSGSGFWKEFPVGSVPGQRLFSPAGLLPLTQPAESHSIPH